MAQRTPPEAWAGKQTDDMAETADTADTAGDVDDEFANSRYNAADGANGDGALDDAPGSDEPDYYAVLGIAPTASEAELRSAYRRLAKLWHPDRYTAAPADLRERAERRMRAITRANSTLSDPLLRHEYDLRRPWTPADGAAADATSHAAGDHPYDGYTPRDPRDPFTPMHHVLGTRPIRVETGYGAYDHASRNPNGAGEFFGLLGLIIGLALFLGALSGGPNSSAPFILVGILLVLGLIVLAGFFLPGTLLARAATAWMEGEPLGFTPLRRMTRRKPGASTKHAAPQRPPAAPPADETKNAGQEANPDTPGEIMPEVFEELVDEAVASLPDQFYTYMENVLVRVEDEPDAATLRKMGVGPGSTLLGLYTGVPLTRHTGAGNGPEIITIYRGPITRICRNDPERIRAQVRATVLHELAHHFGIDHDEMPEWVK